MKHFYAYPKIEYSNNLATNLLVRGKIRDAVLNNTTLYYKYRVDDLMRPEILSYKYYGSPYYAWAIYYANNMTHPTFDWPMNQREFDKYILEKYGSLQKAQSKYSDGGKINHDSIHHYLLNNNHIIDRQTFTVASSILSKYKTYYLAHQDMLNKNLSHFVIDGFVIDKETFLNIGVLNPETVSAVTFYEHEYNMNENKRDILIIDKQYLFDIVNEFENLFD